jgi:hypothetical protein
MHPFCHAHMHTCTHVTRDSDLLSRIEGTAISFAKGGGVVFRIRSELFEGPTYNIAVAGRLVKWSRD